MMFKNRNADLAKLDGKRFALNLDGVMTALSFVILFIVVIIPIFMIIYNAFFYEHRFDLGLFARVIGNKDNIGAMWNTIVIAFWVTVLGTIVGLFYAWLLGRSDIPLKGLMRSLFTIPYMFPPFFGAMAWDLMLSSRGGYINNWIMSTFHLQKAPVNINSVWGIIFVEVSYYFPFVFMQVVSALERMDPTLEESARIAGAKQGYVIRRITLPLVLPAISSGHPHFIARAFRRSVDSRIFAKYLYAADEDLSVDKPCGRRFQRHPRRGGSFGFARHRRVDRSRYSKARAALGQLRYHQGKEHASDADQIAPRKISAAGYRIFVTHRHRARTARHDFSRRIFESVRTAAYVCKLYV